MFEEKLGINLTSAGFQWLNSNTQNIYLYYRIEEKGVSVISIIDTTDGREITQDQYAHIINQIMVNFNNTYSLPGRLLNLVLTFDPNKVKHLTAADSQASHWIVDLSTYRLMIYENESGNFSGLDKMLEQLLDMEQREQGQTTEGLHNSGVSGGQYTSNPQYAQNEKKTTWAVQLTLVNMVLVAINIIAYIITHYTSLFGTPEEMFQKGAFSWYYVVENHEYYRFITSMFMHADFSHIFGNMLVLFFLGTNLERAVGKLKYLFIYFGAGILAGIASFGYNMWMEYGAKSIYDTTFGIGASGAIFGVVGALLFIILIHRGYHDGISASQVLIFTGINIYNGVIDRQIDQSAHVGGFIAGFILAAIVYRRQKETRQNQQADV